MASYVIVEGELDSKTYSNRDTEKLNKILAGGTFLTDERKGCLDDTGATAR